MERLVIVAVVLLALALAGTADAKRSHKQHGKKAQVEKGWQKGQVRGELRSTPFWDCVVVPEDLEHCLPLFPGFL
jgi:hypothetical protein